MNRDLQREVTRASACRPLHRLASFLALVASIWTVSSAARAGDGFDVFFDDRGRVFNLWHHADGMDLALDCHMRDGTRCGNGWPFYLNAQGADLRTVLRSSGVVDNLRQRVWFQAQRGFSKTGFGCVDIANLGTTGPRLCVDNGGFVELGSDVANDYWGNNGVSMQASIGERVFAWESKTAKLLCLEFGTSQACSGGFPRSFDGLGYAGTTADATGALWTGGLKASQGKLYGYASASKGSTSVKGICIDPETGQACSDKWPVTLPPGANLVYEQPSSSGAIEGVCFLRSTPSSTGPAACFSAAGDTVPVNATLSSLLTSYGDWYTAVTTYPATSGTRVYWINGTFGRLMGFNCFDVGLNGGAGGVCSAGWPARTPSNDGYATVVDPRSPKCIWTNSDKTNMIALDGVLGGLNVFGTFSSDTYLTTPLPANVCTAANLLDVSSATVQRNNGQPGWKLTASGGVAEGVGMLDPTTAVVSFSLRWADGTTVTAHTIPAGKFRRVTNGRWSYDSGPVKGRPRVSVEITQPTPVTFSVQASVAFQDIDPKKTVASEVFVAIGSANGSLPNVRVH